MISQILRFALRQRFITLVLSLALVGVGVFAFRQLKIEAYPDISDTQVEIITTYPGLAAEEMEQQITVPLERALNNAAQLMARRSRTIYGLSIIDLTFAYGTNDYFARQVVIEKLGDASLPPGVTPTLAPLSTPIGEMYRFTIQAPPAMNDLAIRELEDWVIAPRLLQVSGVADVTPFGGVIKQYQIVVDPALLEKYGLTIASLVNAVKANNRNAGGAVVDNSQQSMVVRGVGRLRTIDDIGNIVLSATRGTPILVKDVGSVEIGPALQTGIFGLNEKSGGVEGIVLMRRGENPSEVLAALKEAIDELNGTRLPPGVRIVPIYDRTELVDNTLETVSRTLLEGFSIVVLVLIFFLGSPRAAILTAITIPLSLLFAFICMHFNGIPANLLSLGALDFGIIVDGTLVMVEHIVRNLANRKPSSAESVMDVIRGRRARSGAADFLLVADHHRRLHSALHAGARGAAPLHAHGLHGLRSAGWIAAICLDVDSSPVHVSFPQSISHVGKPAAQMAHRQLRANAARSDTAATSRHGRRDTHCCWRIAFCASLGQRVPAYTR